MVDCSLLNLGSCLPQAFFEFIVQMLNAPVRPFLNLTINMLYASVDVSIFFSFWVVIVYMLSMFYSLLLIGSGISLMISGHDVVKRENAKQSLRNIVIMIVLVQASFFIYQLAIDLSSAMTNATVSLIDLHFFLISLGSSSDLALTILLLVLYLLALIIAALLLVIRYAFVAIGVVLFPIAIFFYFFSPLKQYGALILNFLGICIFITFFDAIFLAGFAQLADLQVFSYFPILPVISAFMVVNIFTAFLMLFSIVKAAFRVYSSVKSFTGKL
jgi:hypothetical protein